MPNLIAKPLPLPAEHAPLSVLNRSGSGIRTMTVCSCEWMPARPPASSRTAHNAHAAHRKSKGLGRADYSRTVFGEGPHAGLTWDEWYEEFGGQGTDPYTGTRREW
jgi:hypothetical protein